MKKRACLDDPMLRWLFLLLGLALAGQASAEWTLGPQRDLGSLAPGIQAWEREATQGDRRVRISGVSFSDRRATFQVIDNPPGTRASLSAALKSAGAVAGINASYFHPDFTPLGLAVSNGHTIHEFEKAKLLSGLILVHRGKIELVRAGAQRPGPYDQAVQAGPWLVEKGTPIAGLNTEKLARRSVVITDGKGDWAIVALSASTLADTASILARPGFGSSWNVRDALNLDGGSSTSLVAFLGGKSVIDIPSFGSVRNYLAILPRAQ
jgi:uncharacterized protein YigE (DUF2233 family)